MNQKELTDALDLASRQYYNGQQTQFTDTEFDLLLKDLQKMEAETGVVYPNSPTIRVGSDLQDGFKKIKHPSYMLTIENAYTDEEIADWVRSIVNKYGPQTLQLSIKYDGVSCELHYVGGVLKTASTRGDKNEGDDITENVKTIRSIPLVLDGYFREDEDFYVRGEILLPKSRLAAINEERLENGEKPFANTRNACSGTIKLLNPKEVSRRGLIFRAWDSLDTERLAFASIQIKTDFLQTCGFYYENESEPVLIPKGTSVDQIIWYISTYKKKIDALNLDYDYDGIVVKIDSTMLQKEIGTKDTRAIEWGIARKWNEEYIAKANLLDVEWQVGRTGILTPVGRLEPVECAGVTVSNVTLHNMAFINEKDIRIGDVLNITRSGGVIPYVLSRDSRPLRPGIRAILKPSICPVCGGEVVSDGQFLKCANEDCPAKIKGRILQFCSKEAMDIRSIGEAVVDDLVDNGIVHNISELYAMNSIGVDALVNYLGAGYGVTSVTNMLDAIEKSKEQPFEKVLAALSIPGVGKVMGRTLAKEFKNIETLENVTVEDLCGVDGIGEIMANDIHQWFHNEENKTMLSKLKEYGLTMTVENDSCPDEIPFRPLEGLKVCFTGSSNKFSGDDVEKFLESLGAKCGHSVSGKLDYLITGSKPGASKVKKATDLGVMIIEEDDFYKKFEL